MNVDSRTLLTIKETLNDIDLSNLGEMVRRIDTFEDEGVMTKDTGIIIRTNKRDIYLTILEQ